MEKDFDYYAFISYNREDEKWAKWLQNKLENYKLPAIIRKENADLPINIRPVFRDKTDMEAGVIIDTVQKKLERSQYLIVICSPKAAQSNWVGSEISAFVEMGRSDRIIPFIVDGVPNSNDSSECFHPHIKEKIPEPLGVNINEIGKQQAFVKTAAKLLNLRFDMLWDRFRIAQKKQRLIAAAAGLLCIAALGWVFDYFYPKKEYYADYVEANKKGIPEGIIRLNKKQVKKRNTHYRFEKSQGKLRRVVYANSAGTPVEHNDIEYTDRPSIQELEYVGNRLNKTVIKNKMGKTIAAYFWGGKDYTAIDIKNDEMGESDNVLNASYMSLVKEEEGKKTKAIIKRFKLTRNDNGFIIRREFKRNNGDDEIGASNINGIWGFEYDLDIFGRPVKIRYLGPDGDYFPDKVGLMGKKYEYDGYGNIKKTAYFGKDEEPALNELFWSTAVYEADINGNIISENLFNNYGEPCLIDNKYAKIVYKYDEKGNILEKIFLGTDGKPYRSGSGLGIRFNRSFSCAKIAYKYNEQGNITEESYFDADDIPPSVGCAKITYKYDKQGNKTEEAYFNADSKPIFHSMNNFLEGREKTVRITYKYDKQGNITEEAYFDVNDNLTFNKRTIYKYNDQGNITEKANYDDDGNLYCSESSLSYAKAIYKYNKQGNKTEEAYFGTDGELCLIFSYSQHYFFARAIYKYDEQGNVTEEAYYDADGKPFREYFTRVTYKYNKQGNIIEEAYYDADDNLDNKFEYAMVAYKYDEQGNKIEETYFGTDGKPSLLKEGYANVKYKYDEKRNKTEEAYFDTSFESCFIDVQVSSVYKEYKTYAKVVYKYDKQGNKIEEAYFDTDGKLYSAKTRIKDKMVIGYTYAKKTYKYDSRRNLIEEAYFDTNNKLCLVETGASHELGFIYARVEYKYDDQRKQTEAVYFDTNGKVIMKRN